MEESTICLNCDSPASGNYCSNCGQKLRPTKLPLKVFLEDAFEAIFNVDNRVFKTLKTIFLEPGQITVDYLEGKRARYLPSTRLFMTSSVLYFIVVSVIDTTQFLFIDINMGDPELQRKFVDFLQYSMFLLAPLLGLFLRWMYRKRDFYFVEGFVFSMHIHSIWFFFFGTYASIEYIALQNILPAPIEIFAWVIVYSCLVLAFVYLILSLKKVFSDSWFKTISKSVFIIFLYGIAMSIIALSYVLSTGILNGLQVSG